MTTFEREQTAQLTRRALVVRLPTRDMTVAVFCARRPPRGDWEQRWTLSGTGSKSARGSP